MYVDDRIKDKVYSLLNEFGCSFDDPAVIVTDRDRNMVSAFSENKRLSCASHLIHNIV